MVGFFNTCEYLYLQGLRDNLLLRKLPLRQNDTVHISLKKVVF
jgi:hypothetical protein